MQQEVVTAALPAEETSNLVLILKWGCDSSTGHSQFKQKRSAESFRDANLFLSYLVPLQLRFHEEDSSADARASTFAYSGPVCILWQNPRPSSTRFCRPIWIQFTKETAALTQAEVDYISTQIQNCPYAGPHGRRTVHQRNTQATVDNDWRQGVLYINIDVMISKMLFLWGYTYGDE